MLGQKEYELGTELLQSMSWDDLRSLTRTVTDGIIVPTTSEEAIMAILQHSKSPEELLSRQKLTKEVLFTYLHSKKIKFGQNDKHTLKQLVLQLWAQMPSNTNHPETSNNSRQLTLNPQEHYSEDFTSTSSPRDLILRGHNNIGASSLTKTSSVDPNELAQKFTEWFYSILNESGSENSKCQMGPEHFFQDCSIRMCLNSLSGTINKEVKNNASDVVSLLVTTKSEHNLHFNPNNTTDGVRGKMDPHGLVLVAVCGTLHQGQSCAGVFEQLFGLARDPFTLNNWKIKYTEINLKSQELVTGTLSLENSDVGKLLALSETLS